MTILTHYLCIIDLSYPIVFSGIDESFVSQMMMMSLFGMFGSQVSRLLKDMIGRRSHSIRIQTPTTDNI